MNVAVDDYIKESFQKLHQLRMSEKGEVWLASDKSDKGTWRTLIHQRQEKDIWQHLYEFVLEEGASLKE